MIRVAIFASGTGSNAKALLQEEKYLDSIHIDLIITDSVDAGVIDIAHSFGKEIKIIPRRELSKKEHEDLILKELKVKQIDWIFLAGYMRILSPRFIEVFFDPNISKSRIVNIHPSLLPHYQGLNAYERAFKNQDRKVGVTIHFVDSGVDTGEVIIQKMFNYPREANLSQFKAEGLRTEHEIYPFVLRNLGKLQEEGFINEN